jgi:hypothetical protein
LEMGKEDPTKRENPLRRKRSGLDTYEYNTSATEITPADLKS